MLEGASNPSILGFFVRLEGASFTGSGAISRVGSPIDAFRFNEVEAVGVVPGRVVEAVAAEEPAASLAAERVTLEDMRTNSVLSRRLCPSARARAGKGC